MAAWLNKTRQKILRDTVGCGSILFFSSIMLHDCFFENVDPTYRLSSTRYTHTFTPFHSFMHSFQSFIHSFTFFLFFHFLINSTLHYFFHSLGFIFSCTHSPTIVLTRIPFTYTEDILGVIHSLTHENL